MTLQRKRADCVRRHVGEGRAGGSIDRKSSTAQQDEQDRREIRIQREGHSPEFGCALFKMLLFHSFFHVALAYFLPTSSVSTTIHPREGLMKRGISLCTCTCTCLKGGAGGGGRNRLIYWDRTPPGLPPAHGQPPTRTVSQTSKAQEHTADTLTDSMPSKTTELVKSISKNSKAHKGALKHLCLELLRISTDEDAANTSLTTAEEDFRRHLHEKQPWSQCTGELRHLYLDVKELLDSRHNHANLITQGEPLGKVYLKPRERSLIEALIHALRDPQRFEERGDLTYWKNACIALRGEMKLTHEKHAIEIETLRAELADKQLRIEALELAAKRPAPECGSLPCAKWAAPDSLMCTEAPISEPLHISGKPRAEEQQEEDKGKQQADAERRGGNRTRKRKLVVKSDTDPATPPKPPVPQTSESIVVKPEPLSSHASCGQAPRGECGEASSVAGDSSDPDEELLHSFCPSVFAGGAEFNPELITGFRQMADKEYFRGVLMAD